jgi:hypothetical protein
MSEEPQVINVDDVITATFGNGRIITGWVLIAEAVNSNDEYEIVVMNDGLSAPWKLEGLVNYAVNNGYLSMVEMVDEDEDEEED